jgi:signal transduction histidine kinase
MRVRVLAASGVLASAVSLAVVAWVLTRPAFAQPAGVTGPPLDWWELVVPLSWTATGAALLWLRPRNAMGALILFVGVCQAISQAASAYGTYGVGIAEPHWPAGRWVAFLGSPLWVPGVLPMISVLFAIYPDGRLPGRRWRAPTTAAAVGIAMLTVAMTGGYHDVAPGPPPLRIELHGAALAVFTLVTAASLLGGTLALWVMSIVRLVRARPPERQQLAWLLCAVIPLFLLSISFQSAAFALFSIAVPIAIAVGVLRYHMLGIEVVLRRGLVYAFLTAVVIGAYLLAATLAGSSLEHGAIPGVVVAALVAVGLSPLRERLQRGVDRLVYGDRRDPMRAVTDFGESVAAAGEPADLLPSVLMTVISAVHAPGAAVLSPDGRIVAEQGSDADGVHLPLCISGRQMGTLRVADRRPGEPYTSGDRRLLAALAPQVAVVVSALELGEALEAERDRVLGATRTERDRLRRDLHDGLGPSLSGVGLGLQALDSALAAGDEITASKLLRRVRLEARTAVADVRRILDDLRPTALDDSSLSAAMRRYADAVTTGIPIELDVANAPPTLPPDIEAAAYRIAQEALTNVIRHAGATNARLSLAANHQALRVEVTDDGHGFRPVRAEGGLGLASMRHRAETVGGSFDVRTGDTGTSVVALLPLGGET